MQGFGFKGQHKCCQFQHQQSCKAFEEHNEFFKAKRGNDDKLDNKNK